MRTLMMAGVLAIFVSALLIVACGSEDASAPSTGTPVSPAPTTAVTEATVEPTAAPTAERTAPPTSRPATPEPTAGPTAVPTAPATPAPTREEPGESDPSGAFFAMDRVLEVSIEIAEEDWDSLRHQTRTFEDLMAEIEKHNLSRPFANIYTWFSATVTIDGETHTKVGVRKKGFLGSQSDTKPSLKLRYDKYVDGQSLGGVMERMTLNNSIQDSSMVNTCLSYQVFAAAGLPSPRCNFATVTVNGRELGLYIHLEDLKKPFLARHFDSAEGNLYEGTVSDFTPSHRGTMEKKTNEDENDWSDVDAVVAALQDPSDAGLGALAELVDLDRFLSFWATEVLVGHWDGYAGDRNNYHFYREPDGKFVFLPWGADDTFHLKDDPNPFDNISNPPLSVLALSAIPNRLYNTPEWRAKYAERLKEILDTSWDEDALLASVNEMADIVQEHSLPGESAKAAGDTDRVRQFVLERRYEILANLTPEPPDWPEPFEGAAAGPGGDLSAFEVHFETTWGSKTNPNPFEEGKVTYLLSEDGVQSGDRIEWMGVTAGTAGPEEQSLLPGVADTVSITVMMFLPESGEIEGVTVVLPQSMLTDGAVLTLGLDSIAAVAWGIPSGATLPEWFEPLTVGTLELTEAGTSAGAVISGRFGGATGEDTGAAPETVESGALTFDFETTWGSNKSANPLEEGTITHLLTDGEVESLEGLGVIAGVAGPDERLLMPGVEDLASIAVLGLEDDGSLVGLTLVMPESLLTGDASLVIGTHSIAGGLWALAPGAGEPEFFLPLTEGILVLSEAGKEQGAAIVGTFSGSYGSAIEGEPTRTYTYRGDGPGIDLSRATLDIELRFVSTWGTIYSPNTFAEGKITDYQLNGIAIPIGESAVLAGHATPHEAEDLGLEEAALVVAVLALPDGTESVTGVWLPPDLLESGANLTIGEDEVSGYSLRELPSGQDLPNRFFHIIAGTLEFEEVGMNPGDKVSGKLNVTVGSLPYNIEIGSTVPEWPTNRAIAINEVAAKGDPFDWVELYNTTTRPIPLHFLTLGDDLNDPAKRVSFPGGMVIEAGEFLQIQLDKEGWPGFGLGGDEELGIWTSEGVLVDSVDWDEGDSGEDQSYARLPDGTGEFHTVVPTPGQENEHHH